MLAAALAIAVPATANAATLSIAPAKACYRSGETVLFSGTGYTPGATVNFALDGGPPASDLADAAGNVGNSLRFGAFRGVGQHTFTGTDSANPANVGSASFLASEVTVRVRPASGRPGRRLRIRSTGFTTGRRLWAHILRRGFRRNVRVGRLRGPCRRGNARRRIFRADAAPGRYRVQFDTKRRYSRRTRVRVSYTVTVSRTFGGASAAATGWRLID